MKTKVIAFAASLSVHVLVIAVYFVSLESIDKPISSVAKASSVSIAMFDVAAAEPVTQPPEPKSPPPKPVKQVEKIIEKKPPEPKKKPQPVVEKKEPPKPAPPKPLPSKPAPPKPVVEPVIEKPLQQESQQVLAKQPAGLSDADREGIEDAYKNAVRQAILKNRIYPRQARRRRQEGTVVVAFRLQKNGVIENIRVVSSSGQKLLDKAALEAVEKVGQFAAFPSEVSRPFWDFEIPVSFKLS